MLSNYSHDRTKTMKSSTEKKQFKYCSITSILTILVVVCMNFHLIQSRPTTNEATTTSTAAANDQHQVQDPFMQTKTSKEYHYNKQMDPNMQLYKLSLLKSNNVTCNDGSKIGYYMRLNNHSKSWIIYLQGGGFCGSEESCIQRWQRTPHLMSSNFWSKTKTVDGILSSEPKDNPYLWNANHIYIPYCSSDSWTGLDVADQSHASSSFSFLGSKILEKVLESLYEDLPQEYSLYDAKSILLAGDSAGATGVILNLDKVNQFIENKANLLRSNCFKNVNNLSLEQLTSCQQQQVPIVRGLADSGWFLDNEPYLESTYLSDFELLNNENCDQIRCSPLQSIKQAMKHWNGQVPAACFDRYPLEPWRCYFGYRAYQTLKTPLFVVQWLYDEAQLMADHISRPDTSNQWNYVNKVSNEMKVSLENVTALFAPSCLSHSLITRRSWNEISINGFKLPHILNTWEEQALLDTSSAIPSNSATDNNLKISLVIPENYPQQQQQQQRQHLFNKQDNFSTLFVVDQPTFETLIVDKSYNHESIHSQKKEATNISQMSIKEFERGTVGREYSHQMQSGKSATSNNSNNNASRTRSRKRKRNNSNQQQANRSRQIRQKNTFTFENFNTEFGNLQARESHDSSSSSPSLANPLQDLLPLLDKSLASPEVSFDRVNRSSSGTNNLSNGGRSGRSTIVDDTTLMLSNNVPDDNMASQNPVPVLTDARNSDSKLTWNVEPRLLNNQQTSTSYTDSNIQQVTSRYIDDRFRFIDSCGSPQCNRDCPTLELDFNSPINIQF